MIEDEQDEYKKAHEKAASLLSRRLHTKAELRRKLAQKKFQPQIIEQILSRFEDLRLLNDEQFAEIYLDNLIRFKTFGYFGLKMKLLQRGLETSLIDSLLAEKLTEKIEIQIAQKAAQKSGEFDKQKLLLKLQRKGFRNKAIYGIIDKLKDELEQE